MHAVRGRIEVEANLSFRHGVAIFVVREIRRENANGLMRRKSSAINSARNSSVMPAVSGPDESLSLFVTKRNGRAHGSESFFAQEFLSTRLLGTSYRSANPDP